MRVFVTTVPVAPRTENTHAALVLVGGGPFRARAVASSAALPDHLTPPALAV
jgi:hypothetical protein